MSVYNSLSNYYRCLSKPPDTRAASPRGEEQAVLKRGPTSNSYPLHVALRPAEPRKRTMLDTQRVEALRMVLNQTDCETYQLLRNCVVVFGGRAAAARGAGRDETVKADGGRPHQSRSGITCWGDGNTKFCYFQPRSCISQPDSHRRFDGSASKPRKNQGLLGTGASRFACQSASTYWSDA
eukprot:6196083-Pleurochrysis_carterae.AAC.2